MKIHAIPRGWQQNSNSMLGDLEPLDLMVENYVKLYESRQNLSLLHQIFSQIFIQIAMILEQNDLDGNSIVIGKSKREQTG